MVRLALLVMLMEAGWLAIWPLSLVLTHSPAFTQAFLADHAPAASLLQVTQSVTSNVLPGLPGVPLTEPLGAAVYTLPAVALAAVFVWLAAIYLVALAVLGRGQGIHKSSLVVVLTAAFVFQLTLIFLPGLFSQDVFSYIAYGRLSSAYDLNPYVWPPSAIAKDPVVPWVASVWRGYAAPYGPLWVDVQWLMARLFGEHLSIPDQALLYRLLANLFGLANLAIDWAVLGHLTPLSRAQRTTALAALAWNPLILFEVAGNAHNDVLMVSFSLLALLLFVRSSNGIPSAVAFTLGGLVKYLSGLGLIWVALAATARASSWKSRAARLTLLALASVAISVAVSAPWLELPDSLEPLLAETANVGYVNSLPDGLALFAADHVLTPAGVPFTTARDAARSVARLLILIGFGAYVAWETRRVWATPTPAAVARACALSCLVYVLVVSTSVQTWYFCLPVAMAVALGWQNKLTQVTTGYSLLALPALYLHYYLRDATPAWADVAYGLVPLLPLVPVVWLRLARTRTWAHEPAADTVGDDEQGAERHRVPRVIVEQAGR